MAFTEKYPDDPELRALVDAFEGGDYRAVRDGTARIARDEKKSDAVKAAARDLRSRTEASRAQIALIVIAALLVVALSAFEISKHGPRAPRPAAPQRTIERIQ